MRMRNRCSLQAKQTGFTYLELVFVIILISILYYLSIDKLLKLRADAEQASLAYSISAYRVALSLQMAEMAARDEMYKLPRLVGKNPVDWLQHPPENYAGSSAQLQADSVPPGNWYFDDGQKTLVYRVRFTEFFQSEQGDSTEVRLKVRLKYADKNRNGRFDRRKDVIYGVVLEAVEPYSWLESPKISYKTDT